MHESDQHRSRIFAQSSQASDERQTNVRMLDPPPYEAPSLEHTPLSQRRLMQNRQLLGPVMDSIRNFRPENLRRHQVGRQTQQSTSELEGAIAMNSVTIEEA